MTAAGAVGFAHRPSLSIAILASGAVLAWSYWTTLADVIDCWLNDPQYSHGYLVVAFAGVLLWRRRHGLSATRVDPCWWGLPILLGAVALRLVGAFFFFEWLDPLSLLPCLCGLFVLLGGWHVLRRAWPAIAFLFFMIPLPFYLITSLSGPLQTMATNASTFMLQVLGRPAISEGNVILLNDVDLEVVEACSGLRMLMVFFALSTAMAMLIRKPVWEKLLVCVSAIPIALLTNIVRITMTGLLKEQGFTGAADVVFHDVAGWLMMPLALLILGLELKLLKHLMIEPAQGAGMTIDGRSWRGDPPSSAPWRPRRVPHEAAVLQPFCRG